MAYLAVKYPEIERCKCAWTLSPNVSVKVEQTLGGIRKVFVSSFCFDVTTRMEWIQVTTWADIVSNMSAHADIVNIRRNVLKDNITATI